MKKTLKSSKGFTLIELMVVAVIVAILAAVAVPLMRGNTERAIATEAEAALGTIRSAMRAFYAQYGSYKAKDGADLQMLNTSDDIYEFEELGFRERDGKIPGDLDGTYFEQDCYKITVLDDDYFEVACYWKNSDTGESLGEGRGLMVPKAAEAKKIGYETTINSVGVIKQTKPE